MDLPNGRKIGESTTKLNVTDFASYVNNVEAYAVTELGVILEQTMITSKIMTPQEWIAVKDNPIQRDTEHHAKSRPRAFKTRVSYSC